MKTYKALKLRLYPNASQQEFLDKTLGSYRALFNMMLYERNQAYEKLKDSKRKLYEFKYKSVKQYKEEFPWMTEVDSVALQQSERDLEKAYSNFFKGLSGKYKNQYGFPNFKRKRNGSSYRTMNNNNSLKVNFNKKKISLPKIGWLNFRDKRSDLGGTIKSATISRTPTGKYFVSVLVEQEFEPKEIILSDTLKDKVIGLDMSLQNFFVSDEGKSPAYERIYRENEKKLKRAQRSLSKKKKGSSNWWKAVHKVSKIHEVIKNKRNDFTQKLSTQLVEDYEVIVVESLTLKGMSQTLRLGKSVMDLGYSQFIHHLQYKTFLKNKTLVMADKWFASSQLCSMCGYKNTQLTLSDRKWTCPNCGTDHNRDQNAGQNLKNYAIDLIGLS